MMMISWQATWGSMGTQHAWSRFSVYPIALSISMTTLKVTWLALGSCNTCQLRVRLQKALGNSVNLCTSCPVPRDAGGRCVCPNTSFPPTREARLGQGGEVQVRWKLRPRGGGQIEETPFRCIIYFRAYWCARAHAQNSGVRLYQSNDKSLHIHSALQRPNYNVSNAGACSDWFLNQNICTRMFLFRFIKVGTVWFAMPAVIAFSIKIFVPQCFFSQVETFWFTKLLR